MEKLASQMLDKLQDWVKENPELVKTTLLTSGLGAVTAAALTGKESEHERTSTRVKRRLKNALFGALAAGGSVGLLQYGLKNFSNAKLAEAPTPEEKFNKSMQAVGQSTGDVLTSPWTLGGVGTFGAYKGLRKSFARTNEEAARVLHDLNSKAGLKLFGIPNEGFKADKDGIFSGITKLLRSDTNSRTIKDLVKSMDTDAAANLQNVGLNMTKSELVDALRRAGLDNADDATTGFWKKTLNKVHGLSRRNWRTGARAGLAMAGTAGLGALINSLSSGEGE
jgi:hypothetical protein